MNRRSLRPPSKAMVARAEKGANRLDSLLQKYLDPEELCESLGAVRARALARLSRKFFKQSRDLMERFGSRYGNDSKRALAHLISISVQKEDFSINYDSWLGSFRALADALSANGADVADFLRFSFSRAVEACDSYEEMSAAVRVSIEYCGRFGHASQFCRDVLPPIISLHLPAKEFVNMCDVLMERLQAAGTEGDREQLLKSVVVELRSSGMATHKNAQNLLEFLRAD